MPISCYYCYYHYCGKSSHNLLQLGLIHVQARNTQTVTSRTSEELLNGCLVQFYSAFFSSKFSLWIKADTCGVIKSYSSHSIWMRSNLNLFKSSWSFRPGRRLLLPHGDDLSRLLDPGVVSAGSRAQNTPSVAPVRLHFAPVPSKSPSVTHCAVQQQSKHPCTFVK